MKDPNAIREIPQTHKEDIPLVQDLVQAAYVVMLGWEVGFKYDLDKIRAKLNPRKISVSGYRFLVNFLDQHIGDSLFETSKYNYKVRAEELKVFFECDFYLINTFGEAPQIDEESLDFSYESLSALITDELQNLRDAIDRIQILLSSRILYQDFNAAFRVLTYVPPKNFLNSESNFDISKLNTSRGWKLLAMYKSTTDSSCFTNEKSQNDLILYVYKWMITVNDRIFKVLKPSHKRDDDSRYLSNCHIPSSAFLNSITEILLYRFVMIWTIYQTHYHVYIKNMHRKVYDLTMGDERYEFLFDGFERLDVYFKIRKVFFDFLLGNRFVFNKNSLLKSTKEIRVLERLGLSAIQAFKAPMALLPKDLDIGDKTFWSAKLRKVGPETDQETEYRQRREQYYRQTHLEWKQTRERRIKIGQYQVKGQTKFSYNVGLCFPNDMLFNMMVLPLFKIQVVGSADDRHVFLEAIEFMYNVSFKTMCLICGLSD